MLEPGPWVLSWRAWHESFYARAKEPDFTADLERLKDKSDAMRTDCIAILNRLELEHLVVAKKNAKVREKKCES